MRSRTQQQEMEMCSPAPPSIHLLLFIQPMKNDLHGGKFQEALQVITVDICCSAQRLETLCYSKTSMKMTILKQTCLIFVFHFFANFDIAVDVFAKILSKYESQWLSRIDVWDLSIYVGPD